MGGPPVKRYFWALLSFPSSNSFVWPGARPFFRPGPNVLTCAGAQGRSMTGAVAPARKGLSLTDRAPRYAWKRRGHSVLALRVIPISDWLSAGLATKSMARAIIASTYIRQLRSGLPRCCLHGRSRRRDGTHLWDGRLARVPICDADIQPHIRPARHTRLGGVGTQCTDDVIA
jgi:hypothetical protein